MLSCYPNRHARRDLGRLPLLARRLCEAGLVTIEYDGWDVHGQTAQGIGKPGPQLGQAVAGFVQQVRRAQLKRSLFKPDRRSIARSFWLMSSGRQQGHPLMTRCIRPLCLAAALVVLTPARSLAGPVTSLELHSAPGDYIGLGRDYFADASMGGSFNVATFSKPATGPVNVVEFTVSGPMSTFPGLYADLFFATNTIAGNYLQPGTYTAERYPFQHTGEGGLSIGMDFRGADFIYGTFTILDAVIDYTSGTPVVVSFAATFEQHAEQPTAPPLTGTLYYNYAAPVPEPASLTLLSIGAACLAACRRRRGTPT
jgi:hypothetical protein